MNTRYTHITHTSTCTHVHTYTHMRTRCTHVTCTWTHKNMYTYALASSPGSWLIKFVGEEESLVSTALGSNWIPGIPQAPVFTVLSRITHRWMTSYPVKPTHWDVKSKFRVIYIGMSVGNHTKSTYVKKCVGEITWPKHGACQVSIKSYCSF